MYNLMCVQRSITHKTTNINSIITNVYYITNNITESSLKRKQKITLVVASSIAQACQLVDHKSSNLQRSSSGNHYLNNLESILRCGGMQG
jgi:hypothetical protein